MRPSCSSIALLLHALFLFLQAFVRADCECGYQVNDELYTDLLENDFLHADKLIPTEWRPQNYTFKEETNPFGRYMMTNNVINNPLSSKDAWSGTGKQGGDAGLRLLVTGGIPDSGFVPSAEINSDRADMRYGSFRAGMKVTGVNGTCAAFFWYKNDSQEIDMESVSRMFNSTSHPINLVLHTPESDALGNDASLTNTFTSYGLQFSPQDGFHEYRFDWTPQSVSFLVDGETVKVMTEGIPSTDGHVSLSHWSNGDAGWTGGPPEVDAFTTVSYFKGYFNSSREDRADQFVKKCSAAKEAKKINTTCPVPQPVGAPDGKTYFFTLDGNDPYRKAPNQTVNGLNQTSSSTALSSLRQSDMRWWIIQAVSIIVVASVISF